MREALRARSLALSAWALTTRCRLSEERGDISTWLSYGIGALIVAGIGAAFIAGVPQALATGATTWIKDIFANTPATIGG